MVQVTATQVPPIKHPLALGAAASRFWVPQENGAGKRRKFHVLPMLSGIARAEVCPPTFPTLEHGLSCAGHSRSEDATPEAARLGRSGGSNPGTDYWANLVRAGTLANAAVCNICITSELPVRTPEIRGVGHQLSARSADAT